jgi:hypothetical protein
MHGARARIHSQLFGGQADSSNSSMRSSAIVSCISASTIEDRHQNMAGHRMQSLSNSDIDISLKEKGPHGDAGCRPVTY